ncbi:MAG: hypothetical protein IH606_06190 [Burkholderiales bacterium]|nr:hypothetical protein [Burkholderiales bacterium]
MLRLKPDPLPCIHAVPELLADARLKAVYARTKSTLQVPWMGVVTMAFAHYPTFYGALWDGLSAVCESVQFRIACRELRAHAEEAAIALKPSRLQGELKALGYAQREIDGIRDLVEVFSHGNMLYLMIATAARLLLEGQEVGRDGRIEPVARQPAASAAMRLTLIEEHHADAPTAAVYRDIKDTLGLPFVNTDYRALARWPSYFARAWAGIRGTIGSQDYERAVRSVHQFAVDGWSKLPVPASLTTESLLAAAARDASPEEITAVVRLFQWLLPGLVVNVACFSAQLEPH